MRNKLGQFIKGHKPHPNWLKVWIKPLVKWICPCGKILYLKPGMIKYRKYCSIKCPARKSTKERRYIDDKGYIRIYFGEKYIYEHRKVIEKYLGRKLLKTEIIHHKDGNRQNNKIENLEIKIGNKEHSPIHLYKRKLVFCSFCKKSIWRIPSKLRNKKNHYCNPICQFKDISRWHI